LGFGLAAVIGLPLGALIVYSRPIEMTFYPMLVAFQTIPKAGDRADFHRLARHRVMSKGAHRVRDFILSDHGRHDHRTAIVAARDVYLVRAMGGTPYQVFRHVRFPNALPAIFGGLKVASTLAVIGAIVGEFVSSDTGLGYLLLVANGELDTRLVFRMRAGLTLLGLAFFFAIEAMEKVFVRWHVSASPS
jgi:NitT/TauT family transport system permease protein